MSDATAGTLVTRALVVLPRAVWEEGIASGLVEKGGFKEEQARRLATKILHRIVCHHGYLELFQYDEPELEPVMDRPDNRRETMRSKP